MARFETWVVSDLKKPLNVEQLHGEFFSADVGANVVGVEVLDNGSAASLSGTVTGYIVRADGGTVTQGGTLSSNKASIVLPAAAYNVEGPVDISIKLTTSGVVTTLASVRGFVHRATTDTIVDPGTVITMVGSVNGVSPDQTGNVTLTASNITSGTLPAAQVPNISAAKITSGTVGAARLPGMVGATSSSNGTKGAVPAPSSGDQSKVLKGDGTWGMPSADDVGAISYKTLSSGYDLNNLKAAGLYYAGGSPVNAPSGVSNGWILVMGASAAKQVFFRYGTIGTNDFNTYIRTYSSSSSTWGDWYQVITSEGGTVNGQIRMHATQLYFENANNVAVFRLQYANNRPYFQAYKVGESSTEGYTNYRLPESTGDSATYEILTTKTFDPFYKANDTFATTSANRIALNGYISNGAKDATFNVTVDKSLANITSIAVTRLTGLMMSNGNAVEGSSGTTDWTATGYTTTADKISDYNVRIKISKSTALTNAATYQAVALNAYMTLTFS